MENWFERLNGPWPKCLMLCIQIFKQLNVKKLNLVIVDALTSISALTSPEDFFFPSISYIKQRLIELYFFLILTLCFNIDVIFMNVCNTLFNPETIERHFNAFTVLALAQREETHFIESKQNHILSNRLNCIWLKLSATAMQFWNLLKMIITLRNILITCYKLFCKLKVSVRISKNNLIIYLQFVIL